MKSCVALGCFLLFCFVGPTCAADLDFNRDIRPLLSDRCYACHGPDASHREADLRLDTAEIANSGIITPGKPQESELIARLSSRDPDHRMPPESSGKLLSADEIELIRRWVEQGASYESSWSYVAPRRFPVPPVSDARWPVNWIDAFVLEKLDREGLQPSPDAAQVTLVRRLYFDLTGLPPVPEEVDRFVRAADAGAYGRLVDELLRSDRFGERMATYWLDLVRYADTVGYHGDQDHNISPYRDYVIDAFNDNLPFDQFTREQLAGDLLPNATTDQRIATGYNRLLQTSHEGGVQPKEYLAIYAADRVRNLSAVWMSATMGCCQCHDHKYDPYTAVDFYSMAAFFADIDEAHHLTKATNALPTARPPELKLLTKRERKRIAEIDEAIAAIQAADGTQSERIDRLEQERDSIRNEARTTMVTVAIEPRVMRLLPRGDWLDESGPVLEAAVPAFLGHLEVGPRRATRLDLANWLTDPKEGVGGLTARVFANRLWYLFFGRGLAGTLDDFGGQGEAPVHPELLDALSIEFYQSGWNIKHLVKLMVMSRAYRQASTAPAALIRRDPENRLIARQARFRLPAEHLRDTALALSGLLVLEYGGQSVRPYQPRGYYRHLNFPKRVYVPNKDAGQYRRGVYMHWQRQFLHPMLKAFDAPSREECTVHRTQSNTPLAALTLLNDPTFVEAARLFSVRILREGGETDGDRLDFAFRLAVSRKPDGIEQQMLTELLIRNRQQFAATDRAHELLEIGMAANPSEISTVELAAWTNVSRAILNLSEVTTRN